MKGKLARLLKLLDVIEAMEQTEITVELDCMIFISFLLSYSSASSHWLSVSRYLNPVGLLRQAQRFNSTNEIVFVSEKHLQN